MVGTSTLLKSQGIAGLQKRQQVKKSEYKIPEQSVSKPQKVSNGDLAAQRQYEAELANYNAAVKENEEWKQAYDIFTLKKRYDSRGGSVDQKVKKLYRYQEAALQDIEYAKSKVQNVAPPTAVDALGQGMSVAPTLTRQEPVYDTQGKNTGQVRTVPIPQPTPARDNVIIGGNLGSIGQGMSIAKPNVFKEENKFKYNPTPTRTQVNVPTISSETKRYQDLGYTSSQANKLAKESVSQGGMTYSPERAKEITKPTFRENIKNIYNAPENIRKQFKQNTEQTSEAERSIEIISRDLQAREQAALNPDGTLSFPTKKDEEDYYRKYNELEKYKQLFIKSGGTIDAEGNLVREKVQVGFFRERKEDISKYKGFGSDYPMVRYGTAIGYVGSSLFSTSASGWKNIIDVGGKIVGAKTNEGNVVLRKGEIGTYYQSTEGGTKYFNEGQANRRTEGEYVKKEYWIPEVTSKKVETEIYKTGSSAVNIGKYAIPYLGQGIFFAETTERVYESGGIIPYIKGNKVEAALTGLAIVTPVLIKGGSKVFTKEFKVVEENAPLELLGKEGKGKNVMSRNALVIKEADKTTYLRKFTGTGIGGETVNAGRRVVYQSPFQSFFRMKPTYSGNILGETLVFTERKALPYFGEKVLTISRKEAQEGYQKAFKNLVENRGLTESQARSYLRRYKPSYKVSKVDYSGIVGTQIAKKEVTRVAIEGVRKDITVVQPIVVDLDNGLQALALSKGGKTKVINVASGMEELKTILPKGVEAGGMGESTLFKGSSTEFNQLKTLGKRETKYQDVAVAKKTGEISFGEEGNLGGIEYYKTGSVSRDITYGTRTKKIPSNKVGEIIVKQEKFIKETNWIPSETEKQLYQIDIGTAIGKEPFIVNIEAPKMIAEGSKLVSTGRVKTTKLDIIGETKLPKGVTKEVSNIEVVNPSVRQEVVLNTELGTLSRETFGITEEGTFGSISKIEVPLGVRQTPKEYVKLYHGTTKEKAKIIKKEEFKDATSLTTSKDFAQSFANKKKVEDAWKGIKTQPEVVPVEMPKEEYLKFQKGTHQGTQQQLQLYEEVVIPKEANYKLLTKPTQESQAIAEKVSPLIKTSPVRNIPKVKEIIVQDNIPLMVSGKLNYKGVTSAYAGTGQYEVQELSATTLTNLPMYKTYIETKQDNMLINNQRTNLQFRQPQIEILKLNQELKMNQQFKTNEMLKIKEQLKTNEIVRVQERLKINQLVRVAQQMKQEQRMNQQLKLGTKQVQKQQLKLKTPLPTKIKIPIKLGSPLIKKLSKKAEEGGFEAIGFRFGKEVSLGGGSKGQASKELGEFLSSTLGASGYLKKGKEKVLAEETGLLGNFGYRKSKTGNKFLVVEEKGMRLRKGGTGKEIQYFR